MSYDENAREAGLEVERLAELDQLAEEMRPLAVELVTGTPAAVSNETEVVQQLTDNNHVRVHVRIVDGRAVIDTGSQPNPQRDEVVAMLPRVDLLKLSRSDRKWGTVPNMITSYHGRIPLPSWSNAIAQAIMARIRCEQQDGISELSQVAHGGYLALGGTLYQLNAVQSMKTTGLVAAVKRKAIDEAKAQRDIIIRNAHAAAAAVLQTATETRRKAEEVLRTAKIGNPPPQWAVCEGIRLMKVDSYWNVGIELNIGISKFVISVAGPNGAQREVEWLAPPPPPAMIEWPRIKVLAWVVLLDNEGRYNLTGIHLDRTSKPLPHMKYSASCLAIGDAPARVQSSYDLARLREGIERCFKVVNLASLYNPIYLWRDTFKDYVPVELREAFALPADTVMSQVQVLAHRMGLGWNEGISNGEQGEGEQATTGVWNIGGGR